MPSVLSAATALKASARLRGKHVGRTRNKYAFDATAISASGLPDKLDSSSQELVIQLARGPKIAQCAADVPGGRAVDGCVDWSGKKLSFVATLYSSKTGKAFSDKRYRATLLAAKPAAFGTSKRSFREIGHADFNLADFAGQAEPQRVVLPVPVARSRGNRAAGGAPPAQLVFTLSASHLGAAEAGDDDDDDMSISSAISGFSATPSLRTGSEASSEANLEQDLDGFTEASGRRSHSAVAPESSAGKRWSGVSGLSAHRAAVSAHYTQQAGGMSAAQVMAARQHAAAPAGGDGRLPAAATARDMGAAALSAHSCWGDDRGSASGSSSQKGKSPWGEEDLNSHTTGGQAAGCGAPASGGGGGNPFAPADSGSNPFAAAGGESNPFAPAGACSAPSNPFASNPFEDGPGSTDPSEGGAGGSEDGSDEGGGAAAAEWAILAAGRAAAREAACGDGRQGGGSSSREARRERAHGADAEARGHIRQLQGLREGMEERLQALKQTGPFTKTRAAPQPHAGQPHAAAAAAGSMAGVAGKATEPKLPALEARREVGEEARREVGEEARREVGEAAEEDETNSPHASEDDFPASRATALRASDALPPATDARAHAVLSTGADAGAAISTECRPPALATQPSQAEQLHAQFAWMREQLQAARGEAREARAERDQLAREADAAAAGEAAGEAAGAGAAGAAGGVAGAVAEAAALRRRVAALEEELAESARKERASSERAQAAREEAKAALEARDAVLQAVDAGDAAGAATEAVLAEVFALREEAEAMQDEIEAGAERERLAVARAARAEAVAEAARKQLHQAVHEYERRLDESESDRGLGAAAGGAEYEEQYAELAVRLVDAKLAAAQYAYERDEARQRHVKARAGGNRVAEQLTTMEVRFEELRRRYDADMRGMIELKLQCAEAYARVKDLEGELARRG